MKFGVREICDVVFKAKQTVTIGNITFTQGQPVLYIDSAKTSTIESAATTVYAQGGRGNARLITWEGEKTLTFTVEDALLSPIGFAVLSGAGLFSGDKLTDSGKAMVHKTAEVSGTTDRINGTYSTSAPVFVSKIEKGSLGEKINNVTLTQNEGYFTISGDNIVDGNKYFIDYYEEKNSGVYELVIDAENFGGYYYVEASTLFRRESDGKDLPAEIVFPKVKVQSNFTFNMASSGDPSTFSFVMDAMPDYTIFEPTKKTLCAIQIIEEEIADTNKKPVLTLNTNEKVSSDILNGDSYSRNDA